MKKSFMETRHLVKAKAKSGQAQRVPDNAIRHNMGILPKLLVQVHLSLMHKYVPLKIYIALSFMQIYAVSRGSTFCALWLSRGAPIQPIGEKRHLNLALRIKERLLLRLSINP